MKVLARNKLTDFMRKHASSKKALEAWYAEAERSNWQTPQDIKNRFASADFLADNRVIFNIKEITFGSWSRFVTKVASSWWSGSEHTRTTASKNSKETASWTI